MKRREMVKSHEDFNEIINKGKKKSGKNMIIFAIQKDFIKPNFGIAVGKKLGNAVTRNKYKRIMRHIIDNNKFLFSNFHNYIIMIKKDAINSTYKDLEIELIGLMKEE